MFALLPQPNSSTILLHQACHHAQSFQEGPCECRITGGLEKDNLEVYWKPYEGKVKCSNTKSSHYTKQVLEIKDHYRSHVMIIYNH